MPDNFSKVDAIILSSTWVITRAYPRPPGFTDRDARAIKTPLWHLAFDPPHQTEYLEGAVWSGTGKRRNPYPHGMNSTWLLNPAKRGEFLVCAVCLWHRREATLTRGLARCG